MSHEQRQQPLIRITSQPPPRSEDQKPKTVLFSFQVPEDLLHQFKQLASEEGSNASVEIRRAMKQAIATRVQFSEAGSVQLNEYGEAFSVTKTEAGVSFPAAAYAYVPDAQNPSTWKLRLWATPTGGPDAHIVGAAVAALGAGYRGNKVQIPAADLPAVKAKVKAAWIQANPGKDPKKDLHNLLG